MTETRWSPDKTGEIAKMIKDIDICMFVTRANGSLRGRPMSNNGKVEFDGDSWFFSYRDTPKVEEIEADPRVELAYIATERGTWVSIEGSAEIVEDDARKRELWDDQLKAWFDGGPEDDEIVLLKVRAERIHAWANDEEVIVEPGGEIERIPSS
jgi:general stress protein 26